MMRHSLAGALFGALLTSATPAAAADIILNEYNAVDGSSFLGGGKSDPFWGRIVGNGGDWLELVVITDHLDVRGWELVVVNRAGDPANEESWSIHLTNNDVWADLRSGTIVTISEQLGNNADEYAPAAGRWWLNVRAHPSTGGTYATVECIAPTCAPQDANWKISNNDTQITILDEVGATVFGPAGEGITPVSGIGSTEVLKLEQDPSAAVTPAAGYNDGTSSTFGEPNVYSGGTVAQDFGVLRGVVPFEPMTDVRVNEILSHSDPGTDWLELHNTTTEPIDVGGWFVSDDFADLERYEIPAATTIPAGGYLVLDQSELGFGFSSACGDAAVLSEGDGAGSPTGRRDFVELGALENGTTFGRWPNGSGPAVRMADATAAAGNSVPLLGPIVISEIMYHPADPGIGATIDPEYVELHNVSDAAVTLSTDFGALGTHPWKLTGGIGFEFSLAQTIAADGYLLVVNFDPVAEPAKLAELEAFYGVTVDAVGPYSGALGNFSDTVRVRVPDTPEPDGDVCGGSGNPSPFVPYVVVDEVTYRDNEPWPTAADGAGPSLERRNEQAPADDASNWIADDVRGPTPGRVNTTAGIPTARQQKCSNALNKNLARVAKTQGKESCGCLKDAARDSLDGFTPIECLSADRRLRVAKAEARTVSDFGKSCAGSDNDGIARLSPVGATDAATVNGAGVGAQLDVVFDLLGFDLESAIADGSADPDTAKCQSAALRAAKKCVDEHLKAFTTCKKAAFKAGGITTAADVAACIGEDPKQKIASTCDASGGKLRKELDKRCPTSAVDLAATFPGCGAATTADLAACAERSAACRACIAVDTADDLYRDCDLADDETDNDSCP